MSDLNRELFVEKMRDVVMDEIRTVGRLAGYKIAACRLATFAAGKSRYYFWAAMSRPAATRFLKEQGVKPKGRREALGVVVTCGFRITGTVDCYPALYVDQDIAVGPRQHHSYHRVAIRSCVFPLPTTTLIAARMKHDAVAIPENFVREVVQWLSDAG